MPYYDDRYGYMGSPNFAGAAQQANFGPEYYAQIAQAQANMDMLAQQAGLANLAQQYSQNPYLQGYQNPRQPVPPRASNPPPIVAEEREAPKFSLDFEEGDPIHIEEPKVELDF